MPTGVVRAADVDGDGYPDLFIGVRMTPFGFGTAGGYGVPVGGYLLRNKGNGHFIDVTDEWAPALTAGELTSAGITAAEWGDLTGDGWPDLVVAGEWMPLTVFYNRQGRLERADPHQATVRLARPAGVLAWLFPSAVGPVQRRPDLSQSSS
jgi:enediyne biosynthesis protein E4